jgi:hypothetical protein
LPKTVVLTAVGRSSNATVVITVGVCCGLLAKVYGHWLSA